MIISKVPSDQVVIRIHPSHRHDNIQFGLIILSDKIRNTIFRIHHMVDKLATEALFHSVKYPLNNIALFENPESDKFEINTILRETNWGFIQRFETHLERRIFLYPVKKDRFKTMFIEVFSDLSAMYTVHTEEPHRWYYSSRFLLSELIETV